MSTHETFNSRSEQETIDFGRRLAGSLKAGSTILLRGGLGAGKTTLVKGIASGLGINPADVSSPTFVLIQQYRGQAVLYHVDLYRLEEAAAIEDLGLDELTNSGAIVVIEWADRLPWRMPEAIQVTLEDRGDNLREIRIEDA